MRGETMSEAMMSRRDLFKIAGAATTVAVGASMFGCSSASAAPAKDVTKAAAGVTSVTLEEATTQNVLNVEVTTGSIDNAQGIVYKQVLSSSSCTGLTMDILSPSLGKDEKAPAILFINGGGFTGSSPAKSLDQRYALAKAGYVVASIQHRVVPSCRFPEPLEDCKAAVRWLRANADTYKIDADNIGVMGNSSGGYFATMVGVTGSNTDFDTGDNLDQSSAVKAVIDLYGVSDLTIIGAGLDEEIAEGHDSPATTEAMLVNGTAFGNNKGASVFDTPETAAEASPFTYIDGKDPAFLIFHGDKDTLVSPVASMALHQELLAAGVESERYVIAGAGHGGAQFVQPEVIELMVSFFDKHLKAAQ